MSAHALIRIVSGLVAEFIDNHAVENADYEWRVSITWDFRNRVRIVALCYVMTLPEEWSLIFRNETVVMSPLSSAAILSIQNDLPTSLQEILEKHKFGLQIKTPLLIQRNLAQQKAPFCGAFFIFSHFSIHQSIYDYRKAKLSALCISCLYIQKFLAAYRPQYSKHVLLHGKRNCQARLQSDAQHNQ